MKILFLILILFTNNVFAEVSVVESREMAEAIQESHIKGNIPSNPRAFEDMFNSSLNDFFQKKLSSKEIFIETEFLRKGPTQSGLSYPKFYVWVKARRRNGDLLESGAATLAAINKTSVEVTDYLSKEKIRNNPESVKYIFPAPLVENIIKRSK